MYVSLYQRSGEAPTVIGLFNAYNGVAGGVVAVHKYCAFYLKCKFRFVFVLRKKLCCFAAVIFAVGKTFSKVLA